MAESDSDDAPDKYIVPALERGLKLLGEFGGQSRTLSAPELARRLNLPRSTVFRLLATLESLGFIKRTESGNDYRLGMAVLRLGFEYLSSLDLTELGQPMIERLCSTIKQPCNIVIRDGRSIVYVARVMPPMPFTAAVRVGTHLPAHATVLGHVLLADLTLSELRALYPEDHLEAFSASTPKTTLELFDMVEAAARRGHVVGEGFFEASISTIAAPVRDHTHRVVAALGATIAAPNIEPSRLEDLVRQVHACADELSLLLNHKPAAARSGKVVSLRP
ncbi:IclR family transcriptional regulator [soil metagenome]